MCYNVGSDKTTNPMKALLTIVFFVTCFRLGAQKSFETPEVLFPNTLYNFNSRIPSLSPLPQPSSYMYRQFVNHHPGIFCKMEYKLETRTKLAPRFRLGSLNYTNWMEGKGEWHSRYWK